MKSRTLGVVALLLAGVGIREAAVDEAIASLEEVDSMGSRVEVAAGVFCIGATGGFATVSDAGGMQTPSSSADVPCIHTITPSTPLPQAASASHFQREGRFTRRPSPSP